MDRKKRLDSVDRKIIALLAEAPQISNRDLATKLGVSESTISVRIDNLIRDNVIRLSVQQNIVRAGFGLLGWIDIDCEYENAERIARVIAEIDNVFSISLFLENPFLQVMVFARGPEELWQLVDERFNGIDGIRGLSVDVSMGEACIKQGIAVL
ncbi:MAG: Lrp/AsnC family transcriptional regulator [Parasphingopyxis sp.]|uniref:Lrp/AsnC family transcriptional regulator n=1 Tax=Parasphingopyxis sp. TaxID=1920299 RepID=UPI0032EFC84A